MKRLFIVFIFFIPIISFSQADSTKVNNFSKAYKDLFSLDKEIIFLHLNKTSFIPSESLWFTAYIKSFNSDLPSLDTSNLIVSIYDDKNSLIDRKTIYIENGVGNGHFNLPLEKYKSGNYYIEACTYYSKNHQHPEYFTQKFIILGERETYQNLLSKENYDLQLLPEGGHLISEINNSVGFKLINQNGKGVSFNKGFLINSKNDTLTRFSSNQFGIGKFQFTPQLNETYRTKVVLPNQDQVESTIDKAELTGINIITNILVPNSTSFLVNTNQRTLNQIAGKSFFFAIHQEQKIKIIHFKMLKDKPSIVINIPDKDLFFGVNTITLLNENFKPILERLIFKPLGKAPTIEAMFKKNNIDSLEILLFTKPISKLHNISVSVLPDKTIAYQPIHNIASAFSLKPYIKGKLEKGSYYFSKTNQHRKQLYNLDLLLLTQGWSKILWKDLFKKPKEPIFKRRNGFTVKGKINSQIAKSGGKIFLKTEQEYLSLAEIDKEHNFIFEKFYIEDSTGIVIGLINNKNNKIENKPKISLSITPLKDSSITTHFEIKKSYEFKNKEKINFPSNFIQKGEVLDTVLIKGERKINIYERDEGITNYEIVNDDLKKSFIFVTEYIRAKGFRVNLSPGQVHITSSFPTSFRGHSHPLVIIDGVYYTDSQSYSAILSDLKMADIEYIGINRHGLGMGARGSGGSIKIKTSISFKKSKRAEEIFNYITTNGYAPQKEFYNPKYASYTDDIFKHYGTIGWFPINSFDKNGKLLLKIQNTLQEKVVLYIEGMTEDGKLISEKLELNLN